MQTWERAHCAQNTHTKNKKQKKTEWQSDLPSVSLTIIEDPLHTGGWGDHFVLITWPWQLSWSVTRFLLPGMNIAGNSTEWRPVHEKTCLTNRHRDKNGIPFTFWQCLYKCTVFHQCNCNPKNISGRQEEPKGLFSSPKTFICGLTFVLGLSTWSCQLLQYLIPSVTSL